MIAAQINDAYLAPIIAASFVACLSIMAWTVKLLLQISEQLENHSVRLDALERDRDDEERRRYG